MVRPRDAYGRRRVACRYVRFGERERNPRVKGQECREAGPPDHRLTEFAIIAGLAGEVFDGCARAAGKSRPLFVHPPLEFRTSAQVEAVQERTGVERIRPLRVARRQGPRRSRARRSPASIARAAASSRCP
jgi:hypothetical protein